MGRQEPGLRTVIGDAQRGFDERVLVEIFRIDLRAGDGRKDAEPVRREPQVVAVRRNSSRDDATPLDFAHESRFERLDPSVLATHLQNPAIRFDAHVKRLSFSSSDSREVYLMRMWAASAAILRLSKGHISRSAGEQSQINTPFPRGRSHLCTSGGRSSRRYGTISAFPF